MRPKHGILIAVVTAVLVAGALGAWQFIRPLWPAVGPATPTPDASGQPVAQGPLKTANDRVSSLLTDKVPGARDLEEDADGNVWVSQTGQGKVSLVHIVDAPSGEMPRVTTVLSGLKRPHGLAFDHRADTLYIATETSIISIPAHGVAVQTKVADLPAGDRHFTRSLDIGPDDRLYVSIGSSCDVCREKNPEYGSVISMNKDGSDRRLVATGLRNAVFLQFESSLAGTGLWVTDMGRDHLGDNLPPDEVDVLIPSKVPPNFGWPICYGDGVHDTDFDKNVYVRDPCADSIHPEITLPAHVAPLGLEFFYDGILVAYHGSWNSSVPVGYKVVYWKKDHYGSWASSDFLTGFLKNGAAIGRPVDVLSLTSDDAVLVSDDKSGSIWKVAPARR